MNVQTREELHPVHLRFVENLERAGGKSFEETVRDWRLESVAHTAEFTRCHLCNTRILSYVVLLNTTNQNRVVVGTDCYEKLVRFITTQEITSSLGNHHDHVRKMRSYTKSTVDETVVGWLREQLAAGTVQEELVSVARQMVTHGFGPSERDIDAVVDFYKRHRRFFIERFIPEARNFRHRRLLPNQITIHMIDRIRQIIGRSERWSRAMASARERGIPLRNSIIDMHRTLKAFEEKLKHLPIIVEECALVAECLITTLRISNPKLFLEIGKEYLEEAERWYLENRHLGWRQLAIFRDANGALYREESTTGVWYRIHDIQVIDGDKLTSSGVYYAFMDRELRILKLTNQRAHCECNFARFRQPNRDFKGQYVAHRVGKTVFSVDIAPPGHYFFIPLKVTSGKNGEIVHAHIF